MRPFFTEIFNLRCKGLLISALSLCLVSLAAIKNPKLSARMLETREPHNLLFIFERNLKESENGETAIRTFTDHNGTLAVEEKLHYSSGSVNSFEVQQYQTSESGSLTVKTLTDSDNKKFLELTFIYKKGQKEKTSVERIWVNTDPPLICPDQIYQFLNLHWNKLMTGETLQIRLPVLERLETVGFSFFKEKSTIASGKGNVENTVIKMKPTSPFISAMIKPIYFHFHPTELGPEGRRLLEVIGRTSPKIKIGEKWRDLDVIMRF